MADDSIFGFSDCNMPMCDSSWWSDNMCMDLEPQKLDLPQSRTLIDQISDEAFPGDLFDSSTIRAEQASLAINTSADILPMDSTSVSEVSSYESMETGLHPYTPESTSVAIQTSFEDTEKQFASSEKDNQDRAADDAHDIPTNLPIPPNSIPYPSFYMQASPAGLAMSGTGLDVIAPDPDFYATYNSNNNDEFPVQTPGKNDGGFENYQQFSLQPPVASPAQFSDATTPRLTCHNPPPLEPYLSPYQFQTPMRGSHDHSRRYSNPTSMSSPAYSYSSYPTPTPSLSYSPSPQAVFSHMGTPSSTLTSPEGAGASPQNTFSSHRYRSLYKSPQSPPGQYRVAPYSLGPAERHRWSTGQNLTYPPPSRWKPHLGHSLSESHVPQLLPFASSLSSIPAGKSDMDFSNDRNHSLMPAPDIHSHTARPTSYQEPLTSISQLSSHEASSQVSRSDFAIALSSTPLILPAPPVPERSKLRDTAPLSPPPEDMDPEDLWFKPIRDHPKHEDDVYTPKWKRKTPKGAIKETNEGWCGLCRPGRWLNMKNSRYWDDKLTNHGISALTRKYIPAPLETRGQDGDKTREEGKCVTCGEWVPMNSKRKKMLEWWRHFKECSGNEADLHRRGRIGADGMGVFEMTIVNSDESTTPIDRSTE